jgi:hypothetical protein
VVPVAAAVVPARVRADRAEPKFQEFECNDAGQVPALFFAEVFLRRLEQHHGFTRRGSQTDPEPVPAYCGTTAWNIDFAANNMSSATL